MKYIQFLFILAIGCARAHADGASSPLPSPLPSASPSPFSCPTQSGQVGKIELSSISGLRAKIEYSVPYLEVMSQNAIVFGMKSVLPVKLRFRDSAGCQFEGCTSEAQRRITIARSCRDHATTALTSGKTLTVSEPDSLDPSISSSPGAFSFSTVVGSAPNGSYCLVEIKSQLGAEVLPPARCGVETRQSVALPSWATPSPAMPSPITTSTQVPTGPAGGGETQ